MPATSFALLPNAKKGLFFAIGEESRFFVVCSLHTRGQMFLYQTPGQGPPRITGSFVNTLTRGLVGAPNERAPFRIHDAVVGFVDRCLSGLGISPLRIKDSADFSQADLGPTSAQDFISRFFWKVSNFVFEDFVLMASGTEILWRIFLKFKLFFGNIAFPLSSVLYLHDICQTNTRQQRRVCLTSEGGERQQSFTQAAPNELILGEGG